MPQTGLSIQGTWGAVQGMAWGVFGEKGNLRVCSSMWLAYS